MSFSILDLPVEVLVDIFLFVIHSSSEDDIESIEFQRIDSSTTFSFRGALADILSLSGQKPLKDLKPCGAFQTVCSLGFVCRRFYSIVHHPCQDVRIWKSIASIYGYSSSLLLEDVKKCGVSHPFKSRSWKKVASVSATWNRPFSSNEVTSVKQSYLKSSKAVIASLPSRPAKGIIRAYDMVSPGQGRVGPGYITLEPSISDSGKIFAQCVGSRQENPRLVSSVYGVLFPQTSSSRVLLRGLDQDVSTLDLAIPNQCNLVMEECIYFSERGERQTCYEISRYVPATGRRDKRWFLRGPAPERYVADGDRLLALYSPSMVFFWTGSPDNPARLKCFKSVNSICTTSAVSPAFSSYSSSTSISASGTTLLWSDDANSFASRRNYSLASNNVELSEMLWDINLSRDWKSDGSRELFCIVRNIHITSQNAVVLAHWYPTSSMHKLTGTSFRILDVETGQTKKVLTFNKPDLMAPYPMFTTVSDHDFVVTDTHLVSGGPNGKLFVWNYHTQDTPLYSIPAPDMNNFSHVKGSFALMYTSINISVDGKYLMATANNLIIVWNMFTKRLEGIYNNGRKVVRRDFYLRNPFDSFRTGMWILYRDWRATKRKATNLEKLLSDETVIEEYELISENFKYVLEPFGQCDIGMGPPRRGWIKRGIALSLELRNLIEAILFWSRWLLFSLLASGFYLLIRGDGKYTFTPNGFRHPQHTPVNSIIEDNAEHDNEETDEIIHI
ncbi:hypothetical protein V1512DRAFT_259644 [Lipomyces arxii]|uniref:uncharacterized protein n=1 Tax=Lipomyces arxii TaxID=56418 RepID=UPI0034CE9C08